ncbi:MAG: hypothetical protein QXS21_05550 [Thermoproteota archaeon]
MNKADLLEKISEELLRISGIIEEALELKNKALLEVIIDTETKTVEGIYIYGVPFSLKEKITIEQLFEKMNEVQEQITKEAIKWVLFQMKMIQDDMESIIDEK